MGEVAPDSGHFDVGETVRFGYYSQDGLKFDEQMKVIDVVQAIPNTWIWVTDRRWVSPSS